MRKQNPESHPRYSLLPSEIEGFDSLADLALDMHWSWNHATDEVWRKLDPDLWETTHNPWVVLQTASHDRIKQVLADPVFRKQVDSLVEAGRQAAETPAWFQRNHSDAPLTCVAYFSMEFMLSEALPIYSGGLGNVAGDQLKAASDLGVPVVGVGLLYQQGYFRQVIDKNGEQQALYPFNDPGQLPITPVRQPNGEWLRLEIALPGYSVWLRAWQVQVGRVKLYLLDSNDAANYPAHRGITNELYGGGPELRIKQEMVLGLGGWRLLRTLGLQPEVCHLNEGHAAFAILERAHNFMEESGHPFEVALAVTRAGNLFTTHTAVAAGFDRFAPALMEQYLGCYAEKKLGIPMRDLLALGRENPADSSEPFNMAYLAIRGSGSVNGVSRLHGKVSRRLFQPLFPHWPEDEVPIGHVTNGVHMPTWDSADADDLWTQSCGKNRWLGTTENLEHDIRQVSDSRLWQFRTSASNCLVEYARQRLSRDLAAGGALPQDVEGAKRLFDPKILTLGFARRFATYKRPNLLLHNPQRLLRILTDSQHPVQLLIAGKAHPADQAGQALIHQWTQFIRRPEVRPHAMFLSDYDMLLTERLVQGVDVWINTPRRPWEACGTSGMKVLVNGGVNLSELDGWWAEAYSPESGWALGDGQEHGDDPAWDAVEAEALYDLLERDAIPEFYARDAQGIPTAWVARMRNSMASLTPRFSADRAVREYTEQHYLPGAAAYRDRAEGKGSIGLKMVAWQHALDKEWPALHFGAAKVETNAGQRVFEVEICLHHLDPSATRVELYADGVNGADAARNGARRPTGRGVQRLYVSNPSVRRASGNRLYGSPDNELHRGCGSSGISPNPMAMTHKNPQRELREYISETSEHGDVRPGSPLPFGTQELCGGVNFAIFSRNSTRVRLELFDNPQDAAPARAIELDPARNRTGDVWHVWVKGTVSGQLYAYRVDGPYDPTQGHRFNFNRLLIDPFATAISSLPPWGFRSALGYDSSAPEKDLVPSKLDNSGSMPKCVFVNDPFDWEGDQPPQRPWSETIIYELHVRGFTVHPKSGVDHPGTYRGLVEKIPYLKSLGVTAVELMPVQEFNETSVTRSNPKTHQPLQNFWGYDPVAFFAPKASYSSSGGIGQQKLEFKEMVRDFHNAGIEVILDVVFNHTAEGDELGPTLCFRGIDNAIFYTLAGDKRYYKDFTGTGNTVNANHPVVRDHILSALRHWLVEMHVDGFRFDLASVLGRDGLGRLLPNSPLLTRIAEDPILRDVKIIAEAWDAAGAYQVGSFSDRRWAEWNGRYRDDVRRFWRGDEGMLGLFASRICGSADIYTKSGKGPEASINFLTCHDGFTLNDLVSYRYKHNEANGENNRDGTDANFSENCGAEGESTDAAVESLRKRQIKNFLLTLLISRGVPMLLGGDEFRRTQRGNNNAYCQDNETSWVDWTSLERHREVFDFTQGMIAFRQAHPILRKEQFYTDAEIQWFGSQGGVPDWADPQRKALTCLIRESGKDSLCLMFNAGSEGADFELPPLAYDGSWRLAVDTSGAAHHDLFPEGNEPFFRHPTTYRLEAHSSAILLTGYTSSPQRGVPHE